MGRKGVSKRKPKQSGTNDKNNRGPSAARPGENSSVQSLVKGKEAPLNKGGTNPSAGSNNKARKGK
jgi:hypothetical protein